jgi:hypothetical protein
LNTADIRREAIEYLMGEGLLFSTIDDLVSLLRSDLTPPLTPRQHVKAV